jgi:hypothetical protein
MTQVPKELLCRKALGVLGTLETPLHFSQGVASASKMKHAVIISDAFNSNRTGQVFSHSGHQII